MPDLDITRDGELMVAQSASALDPLSQHECGAICDGDGNTVGEWRVSES